MSDQIIQLCREKYGWNVSFDNVGTLPSEIMDFYEDTYYLITSGKRIDHSRIVKLRQAIRDYPDLPPLYNMLYNAYAISNNLSAAYEILDETVKKFPDYIFAQVIKAMELIRKNKLEEVKNYSGVQEDIQDRFPKNLYHITEIIAYYKCFFELAFKQEDELKAEKYLRILFDITSDKNEIRDYASKLRMLKFSKIKLPSYVSTDLLNKVREPLDMKSEEFDKEIYKILVYDDLFGEWPNALTKYDKQYLCEELVKICVDFYKQYETKAEDESEIVILAFEILAILEYTNAIPLFIKFITQDQEFTDFWFQDRDETFLETVFLFARLDSKPFLDLVMREDMDDYLRTHIFEALVQLTLHNLLLPETVKACFTQILDMYIARIGTDKFIPTKFLTFITLEAVLLNDKELFYKTKPLFDNDIISESYNGSMENYIADIDRFDPLYDKKYFPEDLEDFFTGAYLKKRVVRPLDEKLLKAMDETDPFDSFILDAFLSKISDYGREGDYDEDETDEEFYYQSERAIPYVNQDKTGRNDPCPCGSGKKYKKCCLNKKTGY